LRKSTTETDVSLGDEYLESLADAIADGTPVDWRDAETRVRSDEERGLVDRLRVLARLAAVHRGVDPGLDPNAETRGLAPLIQLEEPANRQPVGLHASRFVISRQLGRGGFGVVYQAYDRERKLDVAIKSLHHADVGSVYDLKNEFRALADLSHPNRS
jgi:hypothetical protein